jgi:hypothetical protein
MPELRFSPPEQFKTPEKRDKLASFLRDMASLCDSKKSTMEPRWRQIDDIYTGKVQGGLKKMWKTAPEYPFQILKPFLDQIAAYISKPIVDRDPYVIVRSTGPTGAICQPMQTMVQYHLRLGNYKKMVKKSVAMLLRRGFAALSVTYDPTKQEGLRRIAGRVKFEVIDPRNFVLYPSNAESVEEAVFVGKEFTYSVQEVKEMMGSGDFFRVQNVETGDSEKKASLSATLQDETTTPIRTDDEKIRCVDGLYKYYDKGVARRVRVIFVKNTGKILRTEDYRYSRPNFFVMSIHDEDGRVFRELSRGFDMVAPHMFNSDMRHLSIWLSLFQATPPVFVKSWNMPNKMETVAPGGIYTMDIGGAPIPLTGNMNLGLIPQMISVAENDANAAARISKLGMASEMMASQTATAAAQLAVGQSTGINEDIDWFGLSVQEVIDFMPELLWDWWNDWYPQHASSMDQELEPDHLMEPWWFEINGETSLNTPQAVLQQIGELLGSLGTVLQAEQAAMQQAAMMGIPFIPMLVKHPDFLERLMKAAIDTTTLPGKEVIFDTQNGGVPEQGPDEMGGIDLAGILQSLPGLGGSGQGDANPGVQLALPVPAG